MTNADEKRQEALERARRALKDPSYTKRKQALLAVAQALEIIAKRKEYQRE